MWEREQGENNSKTVRLGCDTTVLAITSHTFTHNSDTFIYSINSFVSISISDTFSSDEINGHYSCSCLHYSSRGGFYGTEKILNRGKVHLLPVTLILALALAAGDEAVDPREGVVQDEVGDVFDHGVFPRLHEIHVYAVQLLMLLLLLLMQFLMLV